MKKYIIGFFIGLGVLCSFGFTSAEQDIMEVMFSPAKTHQKIVDLGSDKRAVGDEVFRSSYQVFGGTTQEPLLVRITKFLLTLTIVLSVSMVLYNGILWIIESSKGDQVKDAKNNLIYIFVGILLALLSVTLVNLISSIGVSSLDPENILHTEVETVVNTTQEVVGAGGGGSIVETNNNLEQNDRGTSEKETIQQF